jgi:hypothetical protein
MIIAQRILKIRHGRDYLDVPVSIYLPSHRGDHWQCEYEIGWPEETRRRRAYGHDSVQALLLAMQNVGAELYASDAHHSGRLSLEEGGNGGYGFPLTKTLRALGKGEDG